MPLLAIPANDIDTAGLAVDVDLPAAWINRELADVSATSPGPGHLTARVSKSGTDVVVRGHADVKLTMPCARCLNPAEVDLRADLSLLLRPAPGESAHHRGGSGRAAAGASGAAAGRRGDANGRAPGSDKAAPRGRKGAGDSDSASGKKSKDIEYEFSSEEAEVDTFDGDTVVLDDFLREAILLELPNFPLCSEACPGIGPVATDREAERSGPSDRIDPRLAPLSALREKLAKPSKDGAAPGQDTVAKPAPRASARPVLRSSSAATKPKKTTKKKRNKE
jgi:uncharacterized protein